MTISEPATLITDYMLGTLSELCAVLLIRRNTALRQRSIQWWAFALFAAAVGSYAGGTYHGFQHALDPAVATVLWKVTTISMGVASFFLLTSAITSAFAGQDRRWLIAGAALKLAIYAAWMLGHDEFRFVIYDYGSTLAILLLLVAAKWTHGVSGHRAYIASGILVSIAAAAVHVRSECAADGQAIGTSLLLRDTELACTSGLLFEEVINQGRPHDAGLNLDDASGPIEVVHPIELRHIEQRGIGRELLRPHRVPAAGNADGLLRRSSISDRALQIGGGPNRDDLPYPRRVQLRVDVVDEHARLRRPRLEREQARRFQEISTTEGHLVLPRHEGVRHLYTGATHRPSE